MKLLVLLFVPIMCWNCYILWQFYLIFSSVLLISIPFFCWLFQGKLYNDEDDEKFWSRTYCGIFIIIILPPFIFHLDEYIETKPKFKRFTNSIFRPLFRRCFRRAIENKILRSV